MNSRRRSQIRIGISGWTFPPWRGVFYPEGLPQNQELEFASREVNSIEINGTFYSLQRPSTFEAWYRQTPVDFVFALKGPRFITHMRRLNNVEKPLANFFASGVLALKEKLGPILWQLPPNFAFDADRLERFMELLPRNTRAAAKLAKGHESRLKGPALTRASVDMPLRYAMEIRHASFMQPQFIQLLRAHHIALVIADTAGKWPFGEDITTDFIYTRLHGDEKIYESGYTTDALVSWEKRIKVWAKGRQVRQATRWSKEKPARAKSRDVFVYFDNDVKVKSPHDAMTLAFGFGPGARGENRRGSDTPPSVPRLTKKLLGQRAGGRHQPVKARKK